MAQAWCQRRGLVLTGREKDDGVSAWNGLNRAPGTGLDRLLKIVKAGDYLLIEDCDRLSRQDWLTAMNFIAEIVAKGVIVVTLSNGNEIDAERFRTDPGCFLPAVLRAHLGHDENEKKSKRIKESWAARKAGMAKGQAANFHLPCWLGWDEKNDKPVVVENNAKIIREMFRLAHAGLGCQTISRRLRREGWKLMADDRRLEIGTSYVWRTLRNKLVIGWSPYVDPPVPGVYPAIVDEQTFYAVQAKIDRNKKLTTPRKSLGTNLFTGLLYCSKCGGRLSLFSQYRNAKIYRCVVCSDSLHKSCMCNRWCRRWWNRTSTPCWSPTTSAWALSTTCASALPPTAPRCASTSSPRTCLPACFGSPAPLPPAPSNSSPRSTSPTCSAT